MLLLHFHVPAEWEKWLRKNHARSEAVWIKFAKKGSGENSLTYEQAREVAIMFGWIDGLINRFDDSFFVTRFSLRRARSSWSRINRGIAEQLIREQKMKPSGLAQVDAAKANGRWEQAYDPPSTISIPEELQQLLEREPAARKFLASLGRSQRYYFLVRIQMARTEATRRKRIEETMEMLKAGRTLQDVRPKKGVRRKK